MKFENITPSGVAEGFVLLKSADVKTSSKGGKYLDATISNSSGEMNAKLWDYSEALYGEFESGMVVKVRGTVSKYNGVDQFRIERIRPSVADDNIDVNKFVPSSGNSGEDMYNALADIASEIKDSDIRSIVLAILKKKKEALLYWPAAFKMHHAVRGGLLCHTLAIVRLAQGVCKVYPFADEELLVAGAILHDIGKLEEFETNSVGLATGYSVKGNLVGHLAGGAMLVEQTANELGITSEVPMLLSHMLLSHHGNPEFGAAVLPQFLEAELLSQLDLMDATVYEISEAVSNVEKGSTTGRVFCLDNRKLYNHGRTENTEYAPKLFK